MAKISLNGANVESWTFLPVIADIIIAPGDLLYWDASAGSVKPASSYTYASDAASKPNFKADFAGVAASAHFVGDGVGLVKVLRIVEADATITAGTFSAGDLVAPEDATSAFLNQTLCKVADPSQAIGIIIKRYSASSTVARVLLFSTLCGDMRSATSKTLWFPTPTNTICAADSGGAIVTAANANVYQIFGGAIELMDMLALVMVALTKRDVKANFKKGTTDLASITVVQSGSAAGGITVASLAADAARILAPSDTIGLSISQGDFSGSGGTGVIAFGVRYRPLS